MTALELLEELERQIVEWGYINANTTLLFKIRDAIKELEYLIKTKDDEVTIVKTEAIKYNGIATELFVSRPKCFKQIEKLED